MFFEGNSRLENQYELDQILIETIAHLKANWLNNDVGIVASCLKDGDKKVFATSARATPFWQHAERNAYHKFKEQYGEPSSAAVFVVTLSPCINELKYRNPDESSCSSLLKDLNVKRVHFGVLDTLHAENLDVYKQRGLIPSLTANSECARICESLMAIFANYGPQINVDLLGIKKGLGADFLTIREPHLKSVYGR